jgi:hypothetical protein
MGDFCWFLMGTECSIERRFSHEAKPATCKLHPVFIARGPGDWWILSLVPCPTLHITAVQGLRHAETIASASELLRISEDNVRSGYLFITGQSDDSLADNRWSERFRIESRIRDCCLDCRTRTAEQIFRRYRELLILPGENTVQWLPDDFGMVSEFDAGIITLLVPTARVGSLFIALPLDQANIMTWHLVKRYLDLKHSVWQEHNSAMRAWHLATEITDCEIILGYTKPVWREGADPLPLNEDAQRLLYPLDGKTRFAAVLDELHVSDYSDRLTAARFIRRAWRRGSVQLIF